MRTLGRIASTCLLALAALACGGSGGGGAGGGGTGAGGGGAGSGGPVADHRCPADDRACFLAHLVVREGGAAAALASVDAALLDGPRPAPAPVGPFRVWAVGFDRIWGFDGRRWFVEEAAPLASGIVAVHGTGPADVWAVGLNGKILHRTSSGWAEVASGTTKHLRDVWASGPGDAWAVGDGTTLLRWNGSSWASHAPAAGIAVGDLYQVWGSGPDDVWAQHGAPGFLHWNGIAWSSSAPSGGAYASGGWSAGPGASFAVGAGCWTWDGAAWSSCPGLASGPGYILYEEVWAAAADDVWVVGELAPGNYQLAHFDGTGWAALDPHASAMGVYYRGLSGTSRDDVWAVGRSAFHFDGLAWSSTVGALDLSSVWAAERTRPPPVDPDVPVLNEQPPPMTFDSPADPAPLELAWTDPGRCRPAFCFAVCDAAGNACTAEYRCTTSSAAGQYAGRSSLTVSFAAEPDVPAQALTLRVRPVTSAGCDGAVAGAVAGDARLVDGTVLPPPCPADVAVRCAATTTCRANRSAKTCSVPYACYQPTGNVGCPDDVLCPNGSDFCGPGTTCGSTGGVCSGSSYGNYCCVPAPAGGGGAGIATWSGSYSGTAQVVTPGGTSSGAVAFSCSAGSCADASGNFSGAVTAGGAFSGSFKPCGACAVMPITGTFTPAGSFVLSGSSGGGSSVIVTAHRD
jgi:hypothetical protein